MKSIIEKLFGRTIITCGPWGLRLALLWFLIAVCMLLMADYENSEWYALPVLIANGCVPALIINHLFNKYDDDDESQY